MRRVKLRFVRGLEVDFVDREHGVKWVYELADRGTRFPVVIYGPEGCGKSAWLRQASIILEDLGFDTIYINPLEREVLVEVEDVRRRLLEVIREATLNAWVRAVNTLIAIVKMLLEAGRRRVAVLVDEAFQVIGVGREAAIYVKGLLGLIEYPPRSYDVIIAIIATSEGMSRREIGRHLWATLMPIWNMGRDGFKQLYDLIPGGKPDFSEVWRLTGGNPRILAQLYESSWSIDRVTRRLIEEKMLSRSFIAKWRRWLLEAIENPDILWEPDTPREFLDELIARNLIVYFLSERDPNLWVDTPPERDVELGIGRYVAWQTPLHREAVRRALEEYG